MEKEFAHIGLGSDRATDLSILKEQIKSTLLMVDPNHTPGCITIITPNVEACERVKAELLEVFKDHVTDIVVMDKTQYETFHKIGKPMIIERFDMPEPVSLGLTGNAGIGRMVPKGYRMGTEKYIRDMKNQDKYRARNFRR